MLLSEEKSLNIGKHPPLTLWEDGLPACLPDQGPRGFHSPTPWETMGAEGKETLLGPGP